MFVAPIESGGEPRALHNARASFRGGNALDDAEFSPSLGTFAATEIYWSSFSSGVEPVGTAVTWNWRSGL
jgi:hypothetical protein